MIAARLLLLVLVFSVLAGCGLMRDMETGSSEPWVKSDTLPPASDLESLLLYFQYIKGLPGGELGKEHERVRQAYIKSNSDFDRVRMAMVLSLPNTLFRDESRAVDLLDPMVKNRRAPLRGLAVLLLSFVQEQKKLDANAQVLQQKLDALMSLERSLTERERGGAKK